MDNNSSSTSRAEAAAEALRRTMNGAVVVVEARRDGNRVCAMLRPQGYVFLNDTENYVFDVGLICAADAVRRGPFADDIPSEAHTYVNLTVHGFRDDAPSATETPEDEPATDGGSNWTAGHAAAERALQSASRTTDGDPVGGAYRRV